MKKLSIILLLSVLYNSMVMAQGGDYLEDKKKKPWKK